MPYAFMVVGIPEDGFTSAEISDEAGDYIATVFELESGWYVVVNELERLQEEKLMGAIIQARDELLHYVNRKGRTFPDGMSRGQISLWLMQRDDGKGLTVNTEET